MSDTDIDLRAFLWQQLRPAAIRWGVLVLVAVLGRGAAHYWLMQLENAVTQARAERVAADERKRELEDDTRLIAAHRADYRRWVEGGLIGVLPVAERRALWLQQWQQALDRWLENVADHVALTLEPPQDGAGADAAAGTEPAAPAVDAEGAAFTLTHHPLSLNVQGLTDLESLGIVQSLLRELGEGARLTACEWKRPANAAALSVEVDCRARLAYIYVPNDPARDAATPTPNR